MRNADADGAQFGIQACQWRESVPPKKAFRHIPLIAPRPSYTTCRCPRKRQRTAPLAPGGGPAASLARRLLLPRWRSPGAVVTVLRFGRGEARAHAARQTHWRGPAPRATAQSSVCHPIVNLRYPSSCIFRTIWISLYFGFPTSLRRLFEEANAIFASSKGM